MNGSVLKSNWKRIIGRKLPLESAKNNIPTCLFVILIRPTYLTIFLDTFCENFL